MKAIVLFSILGLGFFSFKTKEPKFNKVFPLKAFEKNLALIPEGVYSIDLKLSNGTWVGFDKDLTSTLYLGDTSFNINSFYMSKTEVTNGQYLEFINDIKKKDSSFYNELLPDTMVWKQKLAYTDPYTRYYFRHPSYRDYPVVGVSYQQANYYCHWLTERYLEEDKRKYKKVKFRLPKLNEWAYAASGELNQNVFPWQGVKTIDKKGKSLANYKVFNQRSIVRFPDTLTKDEELIIVDSYRFSNFNGDYTTYIDITAPVNSYEPNGYGLYCMAGNIEEFVAEEGYSKGGSWRDPGYYLQNYVHQTYNRESSASNFRGFRFAMEVVD